MIDDETANELANLYEQLAYNLEHVRGFLLTIDAAVRTMLQFEQLAESFRAKLTDGQASPGTREMLERVDLTLGVVREKAARFRRGAPLDLGPVN